MSAQIIDGKLVSSQIRRELKCKVDELRARGVKPRLDVLVASQDPASLAYVHMKKKWAEAAGILSESYPVTSETTQAELIGKIKELNANPDVHGVLIQHPLPAHLNEREALMTLGAEKDVDGITPQSLGNLVAGLEGFRCATPLGIVKLLEHYNIDCKGKRALVIGRSVILGKPAALMMLQKNATVTIAHRYSEDLPSLCKEADILIAAVGKAEFIKGEWIKPGAVVIDAGYNKIEGRSADVGDCDFASCSGKASWITPVPGGVGPMTVTMLLSNCVEAAIKSNPE